MAKKAKRRWTIGMRPRHPISGLTEEDVIAWFAANAPVVPWIDSANDSSIAFVATDLRSRLVADVSFHEGCPTCGGAYVWSWTLYPISALR